MPLPPTRASGTEGGKQIGKHFRVWIIAKDKLHGQKTDITRGSDDDEVVFKDSHPTDVEGLRQSPL